jgi:hypothetical protein
VTLLRLVAAGVNIGLATVFKHEIGFVLGVAGAICVWFSPSDAASVYRSRPRRMGIYAAAIALTVAPILAYLWRHHALGDLYQDLVVTPYYAVSGMSLSVRPPFSRGVKWAMDFWHKEIVSHLVYFVPALYAATVLRSARSAFKADDKGNFCLFFAALVGCAAFVNAFFRTDFPHVRQGIYPLFVVLGITLGGLATGVRGRGWRRPLSLLGAVAILTYGYWFARAGLRKLHILPSATRLEQVNMMPAHLQDLVDYVESGVKPAEDIFVTKRPMDVYNITGRRNSFRYCGIFPGVFGPQPGRDEAALVAELRAKADVVIYDMKPWGADPNRDELSEYAPLVYSFISQECRPVAEVAERFAILRRRERESGGIPSRISHPLLSTRPD